MEYSKGFSENDELRMRFTVWLKIVVKIDYIRRQKNDILRFLLKKLQFPIH